MPHSGIFFVTSLCLGFAVPAGAMVCNVPGGYASIQLAVDDTSCTEIVLAAGTFAGATLDRDLTIWGQGPGTSKINSLITINAPTILDVVVLSLEHLSVEFTGSDGVLLNSKFVELHGDDIEVSFTSGSGISHGPTATDSIVDLKNCYIHDNPRGILGRIVRLDNCNVTLNQPLGGIQIGLQGLIRNSTISFNQNTGGTSDGGGILFQGPGGTTLTIEDSTISGNVANNPDPATNTADGGGIMVRSGFLFLRRSLVSGNVAGRFGGGVTMGLLSGVAEIDDSTISGNVAHEGGGGIAVRDRFEIRRTLIEDNRAWFDSSINSNGLAAGGGIYVDEDRLDLTDSTVRNNVAETVPGSPASGTVYSGGGLYIQSNQPVTIDGSTISGNFAERDGGGLFVNSVTTMTNVTIAGNRANEDGGGVYGATAPVLVHATVVENVADDDANGSGDGGGLFDNAQVNHSLIGYNTDKSAGTVHPDCSGGVVSSGYSFLRIGDGCAAFNGGSGNVVGSSGSPLDLMLVLPFDGIDNDNNGGPTRTVALLPGSPARDGGEKDCELVTSIDQRGYSRVAQDGNGDSGADGDYCDVGAVEAFSGCQAAPLVLSNITYSDFRSIRSESTLGTGEAVTIADGAKITFEAGTVMSIGNGFRVGLNADFTAITGPISCI